MPRRTVEDFLHPERVFFRMVKDYADGRLSNGSNQLFCRAVVIDVDKEGGKLEADPPNPKGSIRARVYTNGLDSTTPTSALTIFHPMFPYHFSQGIEPDEHVLVFFEDPGNKSNGMWITTVPAYRDQNFRDPEEPKKKKPTSADKFEGTDPGTTGDSNRDAEFGGTEEADAIQTETVNAFAGPPDSLFKDKNVLHIGDELAAGAYSKELGTLIREAGAKSYKTEARVNWGVEAWNRGYLEPGTRKKNIEKTIEDEAPDVVLISLGVNDHVRATSDFVLYQQEVAKLFNSALKAPIAIWITPPRTIGRAKTRSSGLARVRDAIYSSTQGRYVESKDISGNSERASNGVGFTQKGANVFASSVFTRLERGSF